MQNLRISVNFNIRKYGSTQRPYISRNLFCFFARMAKEKKLTVRTPGKVYVKIMQRAYDLNLTHREYYLAVAMLDLGMIGEVKELDEKIAAQIKRFVKELDQEK